MLQNAGEICRKCSKWQGVGRTRGRLTSGITGYINPIVTTLVLGKTCVDPLNFLLISPCKERSLEKHNSYLLLQKSYLTAVVKRAKEEGGYFENSDEFC